MIERRIIMIKYPLYVTLDTNIFVANKFDFNKDSTLGLLIKYVATNKIKIVLSNIVIKEVEKHIVEEGNKICGDLRKLRAEVLQTVSEGYLGQVGLDVPLQILNKKLYREKSRKIWKDFLDSLKVEILDTSKIDLDAIIEDYFEHHPPFEDSDKKRKEFPDAFIANQIRERFGTKQIVAIISNDSGLKRACGYFENHIFYETLGQLYDAMNRQEEEYQKIVQNINFIIMNYISDIELLIMDNDRVEVHGLSYDKDGIVAGFDYNETVVVSIRKTKCKVRTIDEITVETVRATLLCTTVIDVECSYDDYDNAAWDCETKSYYFLETRKNIERHSARFGIRIEVDRKKKDVRIIPFKVILNGDTLQDRVEIDENDREERGFYSLNRYSDYLENDLSESLFMMTVIDIFEKINKLYKEYEDMATVYKDFVLFVKEENKAKNVIKKLVISMDESEIFPELSNLNEITDEEMKEVILWAEQSYNRLSEFSEQASLPDYITYGETIEIRNGEETYMFDIGELLRMPLAGDEEKIDLLIKDRNGTAIAKGYVKLIVGYLDLDEDGQVGNGLEDDIEYCCEDIINTLENIAKFIDKCVKKEWDVVKKIEKVI